MFKQFEQIRKNNSNPQEILNEMTSKYSSDQMTAFRKFANNFGITDEQLDSYGIKTH